VRCSQMVDGTHGGAVLCAIFYFLILFNLIY
jgi:hypothetical protein